MRVRGVDATHRDPRDHQLVDGPECGRKESGIELGERARRVECLRRPPQIARRERHLGLRDDAPRTRDDRSRTEGARGTAQERLRANEIAELRHGDPAKRKRVCIVAQRHLRQGAEWITRRERTRRGRDAWVVHQLHRWLLDGFIGIPPHL